MGDEKTEWISLCHLDDLVDGRALGVDPFEEGNDRVFIVRREGRLFAYRNICPHQGATLPWKKNEYLNHDGSKIVCAAHGAEFDIASGQCTLGAALGMSLLPVTLQTNADGFVQTRRDQLFSFY